MKINAYSRLVQSLIEDALNSYDDYEHTEDIARQFKGCTLYNTPSNPPYSWKELIEYAAYPENSSNLVNDSIDLFFDSYDKKEPSPKLMKDLMLELVDSDERYDILVSLIYWNRFAPKELYKIWKDRLTTILEDNL